MFRSADEFRRSRSLAIAALSALVLVSGSVVSARTVGETGFGQTYTRSQVAGDGPSLVTTPVPLIVDGVKYTVPRNFIIHMFDWNEVTQKDGSPTLRVTLPGFQPLTQATKACLISAQSHEASECKPLDFTLGFSTRVAHEEESRWSKILHNPRDPSMLKKGPDGYTVVDMRLASEKTVRFYLKDSGTRFIHIMCIPSAKSASSTRDASKAMLCVRHLITEHGGGLEYHLTPGGLRDVEDIDRGLSAIVDPLTNAGAKP